MASDLKLEVSADTRAVIKELNKVVKSLNDTGKQSEKSFGKLGKQLKKAELALAGFGANLATRAFDTFKQGIGTAIRSSLDFEKAVSEINTILPRNEKLTEAASDALRDFAGQFGTTSTAQAKAFYQIVSAGVSGTANQIELLETANRAALAGLVDVNSAVDILTTAVNSYSTSGLSATEASDALFAAVREGKTTLTELANTVGTVAPIAQSAGLRFSEVTGSLAFFTKQGLQTDIAVTGLRAALTSIIKPSKEASDTAKKLGIDFSTNALRSKGFAAVLKEVAEKTKGSETEIAKLFGNVRALTPILATVRGDFDDFNRILETTKNSAGQTAKAADEMKKALDFQLDKLIQNFTDLGQSLFDDLSPAINIVTTGINKLFESGNNADELRSRISKIDTSISNLNDAIENGPPEGLLQKIFGGADEDFLRKRLELLEKQRQKISETLALTKEEKSIRDLKEVGGDIGTEGDDGNGGGESPKIARKREELVKIAELEKAFAEKKLVDKELEEEANLLKNEEEFIRLEEGLGREATIKELARIADIEGEQAKQDALLQLFDKAEREKNKKLKEFRKIEVDLENKTQQQKINLASNAANFLTAVAGKQTKAAFILSKVAAAGNVLVADGQARAFATAASAAASIAAGPLAPAAFAANLATYNALITANTGLALGTIAAQTIQGFQNGGFVGGASGASSGADNRLVTAREGELFLNAEQQATLFNAINGGNVGGGETVIQIDGREIARTVRDQREEGFSI